MSTISCTIRGNAVSILADTSGSTIGGNATGMSGGSSTTTLPTITAAVEVRDVLKLTVIDASGTAVYYRGDPVVLTDSVSGVLYSGYVQTSDPTKLSPDPASTTTFHTITCMDKQYLFDKRTNNLPYLNMVAGDIAVDLVRRIGSAEGVTVAAAMDRDTVQADFATGTLSGTVATSNVGDGDLELATAGSAVSFTETTTADFAAGTLTNVTASNNALMPTTVSGLAISAQLPIGGLLNSFISIKFWAGSMVVGTSDTLNYSLWLASASAQKTCTVDLTFSDGTTLSTTAGIVDQNSLAVAATTDLSTVAVNQWYTRTIALTGLTGKTVIAVLFTFAGTAQGTSQAYLKNVYLGSQTGNKFFAPTALVPNINPPAVSNCSGYAPIFTGGVEPVFDPAGSSRVSTSHSISGVGLVRSTLVSSTAITPGKSTCTLSASYDGGSSWFVCGNVVPLPGLPPGSNVSGLSMLIKETFGTADDPTTIPVLEDVAVTLSPAANATKSDMVQSYITQANWNTGTLTNANVTASGDVTLSSASRNWDNGVFTGQTTYALGTGSVSAGVSNGQYYLQIITPKNVTSVFTFAGQYADFTMSLDITTSAVFGPLYSNIAVGYRLTSTTAYSGYALYGQSSGGWVLQNPSGAQIGATYATNISANTTYHITIVVTGSLHQVYIGGVLVISATDAGYTGAGWPGCGAQDANTNGETLTTLFDNLVIYKSTSGTWQSAAVSISSLGTCGLSALNWTEVNTTAGAGNLIIQSSIDAGASWQACTNNAPIASLPVGTSVAGKSLLIKATLASGSLTALPILRQLVWRVLGAYPGASGTRVNPVLSLTPAVRAGSTSVSWDATLPTGTTLVVATSPDNITYTTIAASGNPVASIYAQPAPQIDVFTINTLASYTNTSKSGGSVATVTYTTASSLLTLAGGSGALYLYTAISRADVDLICDMDRSDAGGLVWRFVNNLNYYELGIYDDSSSGGYTSQARLYKVAAGVRSLLGVASPIVFPRSTPGQSPYQRTHVTMAGAVISVFYEGVLVQSYTDGSPLAAGQMGLRNDGGTSRYYQLRLQPLGDLMTGQNLYIKETLTTSDPAMMPQLLDLTASVRGPGLATGALIPQLHAPTVPIAEFLNSEMTAITTASGDYYWNINNAGALSFAARNAVPAPWCLFSTDLIYEANVTPTSTSDLYRNRQNITNCTGVTALLHEQMITDGSASSWKTLNPIYSAPAISVQGIAQTVGVQSVDTGKQFYWTSNSVSFGQDAAAVKLPAGYIIDIWYVGQYVTTVTQDNAAEQTARAAVEIGTSGIIEASEDGQGMLASAATTYAQGLLARYGLNNAVQVVAATQRAGLAPGMLLPVFLPEHSLGNAQMLVTGVNTTMQQQADGSVLYFYQITATQGSNLANWTKVFGF